MYAGKKCSNRIDDEVLWSLMKCHGNNLHINACMNVMWFNCEGENSEAVNRCSIPKNHNFRHLKFNPFLIVLGLKTTIKWQIGQLDQSMTSTEAKLQIIFQWQYFCKLRKIPRFLTVKCKWQSTNQARTCYRLSVTCPSPDLCDCWTVSEPELGWTLQELETWEMVEPVQNFSQNCKCLLLCL